MLSVGLRSLLSHKLRLALTALAIVLGVAFVAGTLIITDTINGVFGNIFSTASRGIAVVVQGQLPPGNLDASHQRRPFPVRVLGAVRGVPGSAGAVGVIFRDGADLVAVPRRIFAVHWPESLRRRLQAANSLGARSRPARSGPPTQAELRPEHDRGNLQMVNGRCLG